MSDLFSLIKSHKWDEFRDNLTPEKKGIFNKKDEYGNYLLTYIVLFNKVELIKTLFNLGARLDIVDTDGRSLLFICITYGYINAFNLLLSLNKREVSVPFIDIKDKNGDVPIHYAINNLNYMFTKRLIESGSNTNIQDKNGNTCLHLCVHVKSLSLCQLLIDSGCVIDSKTNNFDTPLHIACITQEYSIVKLLLEKGAAPNQENKEQVVPLIYAVMRENYEIVEILIAFGANTNSQDFFGNTPLHYACKYKNIRLIKLLLPESNLGTTNARYQTPLHCLFESKYSNDIDEIAHIIKNTNLNIQDINGTTCLHYISIDINTYKDILQDCVLDPFIRDKDGLRPIDKASNPSTYANVIAESYIRMYTKNDKDDTVWGNILELLYKNEFMECSRVRKLLFSRPTDKKTAINRLKDAILIMKNESIGRDTKGDITIGTPIDVLVTLINLARRYDNCSCIIKKSPLNCNSLEKHTQDTGIVSRLRDYLDFEIVWTGRVLYFHINPLEKNTKYVITPISIEVTTGCHSNYLITDLERKEAERFEPYGSGQPYGFNYNRQDLDKKLKEKLNEMGIKYIAPIDYLPKIGFQTVEVIEDAETKGYCLFWCIWYTDMRMKFHGVPRETLIIDLIKKLKLQGFSATIKDYTNSVLENKNEILNNTTNGTTDIEKVLSLIECN